MNSHIPFDANNDWTLDPYHCNRSNDPLVDKLIGNAYHVVRTVYCNLGNLKLLYDYLTTHGMVVGVQSEVELKALPKQFAKFARIYNFASTGDRQVTDYLYVDDDASGIKPDDPTLTGSWIKVAVSGSTGGGEGGGEGAYIPYVYANGSALGGETSFKVPDGTIGVPFLIINGSVQYIGFGFTYSAATATVTLSNPLVQGDEVIALTTAIPANPDNPEVPGWVQVNWLYNNGSAVGGEQVITVPYNFQDVPAVYKNGLRLYKGLQSNSYVIDPDTHTITMTEILNQGDRVIVTLGGESETLTVTDRTLQEVARATNVKDSDVVLSTSTSVVITNKKVLYDVSAQKYWGLPDLPPNAYIVKVEGDKLTYNPGSVTVNLIEKSDSSLEDASAAYTGINIRQRIIDREEALKDITRIRIVTWNVATGFQIMGWEPNRDFSSSLIKERIRQEMLKLGADFVGLQECWSTPQSSFSQYAYYPYIDTNSHVTSIDNNSRRFGTGVISTRALSDKTAVTFNGVGNPADPTDVRGYTRSVITVGFTQIAVYNTHMSLDQTKRNKDIAQLFAAAASDTISHVVLTGDWNTQSDADFSAFTNAGFGIINHYGEFDSNNHGSPWWIDRILYRGFSSVADKGVMEVPYEMSDHRPIFAELVL